MANKKAEYELLTAHEDHEEFPCGSGMTREEMLEWAKHYALESFNEEDPSTASAFSYKAETLLMAMGYTFSCGVIVNRWREEWLEGNIKQAKEVVNQAITDLQGIANIANTDGGGEIAEQIACHIADNLAQLLPEQFEEEEGE